jgi:uncharacterized iron-regulated membrane protein
MIRKSLFWLHLIAGVLAGIVILIMSVTGVLLTYEKQIIAWAESDNYTVASSPSASVEALLVSAPPGSANVTLRRDEAPKIAIPGAPQSGVRQFFRTMTDWHRWLGASPENRATPRAITGASNLAFLFIVVSGLVLWFPRVWSWKNVRAVTWFRGGLAPKARDFNWHNTAGFWTAIPLFVIVLSGVVMSYPWANDLVYTMNGVQPPAGKGKAKGGEKGKGGERAQFVPVSTWNIDPMVEVAKNFDPEWRTITFTAPRNDETPVTFTIETGTSAQPQYRSTITMAREDGTITKTERFSDQDTGRRARSWMRFAHTGEYYGIVGQTIAGIASLAGVLLVWTGIALAYRRLRAWLARRNKVASVPEPAPTPDKVAA